MKPMMFCRNSSGTPRCPHSCTKCAPAHMHACFRVFGVFCAAAQAVAQLTPGSSPSGCCACTAVPVPLLSRPGCQTVHSAASW
jgi:hypothetical protein